MYINDWVTIQDIGGYKGFRGICALRVPFFALLRLYDGEHPLNHKIGVSNYVTYNIQSEHYSTYTTELANDFYIELNQFIFLTSVLLK